MEIGVNIVKKFVSAILLVPVVILINYSFLSAENAKDIIKRVKEKYSKITSLQADFEQIFSWELAGETQKVQGTISLTSGNSYRIETDSQLIVTNGQDVWIYSKSDGQVIVDLIDKSGENPLPKDLLFKYSEEYKPHLVSEEKIDDKKVYVLNMVPKDEDGLIASMKIWVDASSWLTLRIEQVDINENVNTYNIRNIRENVELDPSLFNFTIPHDSEVVDLREN